MERSLPNPLSSAHLLWDGELIDLSTKPPAHEASAGYRRRGALSLEMALFQSFQFGDLLFEGIRIGEHGVLHHREHRDRLYDGANRIELPLPPADGYDRLIACAAHTAGSTANYIRVFALRDATGWSIDTRMKGRIAPLLAITGSIEIHHSEGLRLKLSSIRKPPFPSVDATMKWGGNYLNNKRALRDAYADNCDDVLILSHEGFISEAAVENIFWARGGTLFTPSADTRTNCLPGITRHHVITLAEHNGLRLSEGYFSPDELVTADEAFLTGTGAGIVPVHYFEGHRFRPTGEITAMIAREYHAAREQWSTPITRLRSTGS